MVAKLKPKVEPVTEGDLARAGSNAARQLYSKVERIERMSEEIEAAQDDRKEIYDEAKAEGFDTAIIRKIIMRRRKGAVATKETDSLIDTYEAAIEACEKAERSKSEREGA